MKFILFIVFSVSISLISCQKDYTPQGVIIDTIVPPPFIGDSSYIDTVFNIYKESGFPNDTSFVKVNYDVQKRIISLINGPAGVEAADISYLYAANDSLSYLSILKETLTGEIDSVFHFYNASGKLIKDSTKSTYGKAVVIYNYTLNKIFGNTQYSAVGAGSVSQTDTATLDANGNIIANRKWDNSSGSLAIASTSAFTFDNKLNAFAGRNIYATEQGFPNGETQYFEHLFYNNLLSQNEYLSNNNSNFQFQYSLIYYPNNRIKSSTATTTSDTSIYLFKYRKF